MRKFRYPRSRLGAGLAVAGCGLLIAACGGGGSSSSSTESGSTEASGGGNAALEEATANLEEASKIPQFTLEAPSFDASKAAGKTIVTIPLASTDPYVADIDSSMHEVADKVGVKLVSWENEGSPQQQAQGIEHAIATKADVIVLQNLGPESLMPQLRSAKKAGIPVVVSHWYQNDEPMPAESAEVVTAQVTAPFAEGGKLSVDYAVTNSEDTAHPLIVTTDEFPISLTIKEAMKEELAAICSDCEAEEINVPLAEWQNGMSGAVQSALTKNPEINWVLPLYDSMSVGVEAGIRAAGKSSTVKIASFNGTPSILQLIQEGDIMQADMAEDPNWIGWATMDQAMRIAAGAEPIEDGNEHTPIRVFDDSNISEVGEPPVPGQGYGDAYEKGYEEMWGL